MDNFYHGYGELHGGSLGEELCKPEYPCDGPDPDRVEEGNAYFDKEFPKLTRATKAEFVEVTAPDLSAAEATTSQAGKCLCVRFFGRLAVWCF